MIAWRDISTGPRDGSMVWGFGGNLHKRTIYRIRWFADEASMDRRMDGQC